MRKIVSILFALLAIIIIIVCIRSSPRKPGLDSRIDSSQLNVPVDQVILGTGLTDPTKSSPDGVALRQIGQFQVTNEVVAVYPLSDGEISGVFIVESLGTNGDNYDYRVTGRDVATGKVFYERTSSDVGVVSCEVYGSSFLWNHGLNNYLYLVENRNGKWIDRRIDVELAYFEFRAFDVKNEALVDLDPTKITSQTVSSGAERWRTRLPKVKVDRIRAIGSYVYFVDTNTAVPYRVAMETGKLDPLRPPNGTDWGDRVLALRILSENKAGVLLDGSNGLHWIVYDLDSGITYSDFFCELPANRSLNMNVDDTLAVIENGNGFLMALYDNSLAYASKDKVEILAEHNGRWWFSHSDSSTFIYLSKNNGVRYFVIEGQN